MRFLVLLALLVYSAVLTGMETVFSWNVARYYYDSLSGPVPFHGVNTTLSVFFTWAAALLFAVGLACMRGVETNRREKLFFISQMIMFFLIGADDRFLFHVRLGDLWTMNYSFLVLLIGLVELVLLVVPGKITRRSPEVHSFICFAGIFFLGQLLLNIIAFQGHEIFLLGLEDLMKMWSSFFIFLFAWSLCQEKIETLKRKAAAATGRKVR